MKERPIIFSAPMVRAILAGLKTTTRRVVRPQPEAIHGGEPYWSVGGYRVWEYRETQDVLRKGGNPLRCPYGQPGDRLWTREAYKTLADWDHYPPREIARTAPIWYLADGPAPEGYGRYRHGKFMMRWMSRGLDEITAVRVEQLNEISEADCLLEGIPSITDDAAWSKPIPARPNLRAIYGGAYCRLWESINGPGSWAANPWVWVIEFRRAEAK